MTPLKWAELAPRPDRKRFDALSAALKEAGCANEVSYLGNDGESLESLLKTATANFARLRLGGEFCRTILTELTRAPSLIFSVGAADALTPLAHVSETPPPLTAWWPRCFLTEGLMRLLVEDIRDLDLSGGVFLLGLGYEARAVVAAMTRLGFSRFTLSDLSAAGEAAAGESSVDAKLSPGESLVQELRRTYFGSVFQFVPRHMITQLPSVNSVAVNTLVGKADAEAMSELFYFNFLKAQGLWMDLACIPTHALDNEARAMGLRLATGVQAAAWADCAWAREALGIALDPRKLSQVYETAFQIISFPVESWLNRPSQMVYEATGNGIKYKQTFEQFRPGALPR